MKEKKEVIFWVIIIFSMIVFFSFLATHTHPSNNYYQSPGSGTGTGWPINGSYVDLRWPIWWD